MTVKELIKKLSEYPDDTPVFMDERQTDFRYGLVNTIRGRIVKFSDSVDKKIFAYDKIVILSEE